MIENYGPLQADIQPAKSNKFWRAARHITRQGASRLRYILVEAAWKAIKVDPILEAVFCNIAARRGKQRAIVATARHLIGHLRACFRKHELWKKDLKAIAA